MTMLNNGSNDHDYFDMQQLGDLAGWRREVGHAREVKLPDEHVLMLVLIITKTPVSRVKCPNLATPSDTPRLKPA
jgi:hypothetical protein